MPALRIFQVTGDSLHQVVHRACINSGVSEASTFKRVYGVVQGVYRGNIGITENEMETSIMGYIRVLLLQHCFGQFGGLSCFNSSSFQVHCPRTQAADIDAQTMVEFSGLKALVGRLE